MGVRIQMMPFGRPMHFSLFLCVTIIMLPSFIASRHIFGHYLPKRRCCQLAFVNHFQRHSPQPNKIAHRYFHKTGSLHLNRILFDTSEIDKEEVSSASNKSSTSSCLTVTFPKDDYRTVHVAKILGLQNGDTLRAGSVRSPDEEDNPLAGLITDNAIVTWLPEGKIKKAQPTKNGDPPGSLQISIPHPTNANNMTSLWNQRNCTQVIENGDEIDPSSDTPRVSLLLALPRPLQLGRILPMVSQLGVDQLILTNAKKVPKDYFGSHIFRKPEVLRGLLVEGLAQSGDVKLPNVTITKRLKIFMEDELDEMFPPGEVARVIAHPQRKNVTENDGEEVNREKRMSDVDFPSDGPRRILVAVG